LLSSGELQAAVRNLVSLDRTRPAATRRPGHTFGHPRPSTEVSMSGRHTCGAVGNTDSQTEAIGTPVATAIGERQTVAPGVTGNEKKFKALSGPPRGRSGAPTSMTELGFQIEGEPLIGPVAVTYRADHVVVQAQTSLAETLSPCDMHSSRRASPIRDRRCR
jgi:hypothetical protein